MSQFQTALESLNHAGDALLAYSQQTGLDIGELDSARQLLVNNQLLRSMALDVTNALSAGAVVTDAVSSALISAMNRHSSAVLAALAAEPTPRPGVNGD